MNPVSLLQVQCSRYSDSLHGGWFGDRIPVGGGAIFSLPVQIGPGADRASYTVGSESFSTVLRPGLGVTQIPSYSTELKKTRTVRLLRFCAFMADYREKLPLPTALCR